MVEVIAIDMPELRRFVAIHNAVRPHDPITAAGFADWRRQAADMVWLVAMDDGVDVAAGMALVGWHSTPGTARAEAWTLPEHRGRGAATALYRELLSWAAERGSMAVETSVAEDDASSLEWANRFGFREIGRELRVSLDLRSCDMPAIDPPDGVEIVSWADHPDLARGMYDVFVEADPDIPGSTDVEIPPYAEWLADDMEGSSDRADAVFVAVAADEVIGYAKLSIDDASTGVAYHDLTGVKRAWRGHGVASALKRAQIRWAKEQGFNRLTTMNDERNAPIRHLNQRYGYQPEPGRIVLSTTIAAAD